MWGESAQHSISVWKCDRISKRRCRLAPAGDISFQKTVQMMNGRSRLLEGVFIEAASIRSIPRGVGGIVLRLSGFGLNGQKAIGRVTNRKIAFSLLQEALCVIQPGKAVKHRELMIQAALDTTEKSSLRCAAGIGWIRGWNHFCHSAVCRIASRG